MTSQKGDVRDLYGIFAEAEAKEAEAKRSSSAGQLLPEIVLFSNI